MSSSLERLRRKRAAAKENLELRVLSTGKGWRVDSLEIGACERRTVARTGSKNTAIACAVELAQSLTRLGTYGTITLMIQEVL